MRAPVRPGATPAGRRALARLTRAAAAARPPLVAARALPRLAVVAATDRGRLPERVRDLLIALGPVYVKLGQVLSTRSDALPAEWTAALAGLRDALPPVPRAAVDASLLRALGTDAVELDPTPVAAGSVAQVYRGRLRDGRVVAVKVLRPGAAEAVAGNLGLVLALAAAAQRVSRRARVLDVHGVVRELGDLLLSQTDLREEGRNYRRFAREFADDPTVRLPRVIDALTTEDVLVTEFVDGVDPYDTGGLPLAAGRLARRFDDLVDSMIFVKGLCHADLHPGNFFWDDQARVVLVDLGLVHRMTEEQRRHLWAFYSALLDGFEQFAAAYVVRHLTAGAGGSEAPQAAVEEIAGLVRRHWVEAAGRPSFAPMFVDLLGALGRHGLQLRPDYSRLFLTLATVEGYLFSLDPDFDTLENARRKRVEQTEYVGIPPAADELVFQGVATYSTAMFGEDRDPRAAWAERDRFVLDQLHVGAGTSLLDVGCGRGQLMAAAAGRGARPVGVTVSRAEHDACRERGLDAFLTSWQDADRALGEHGRVFDAIAAIEMDAHLGTLYESRAGLLDLRLRQFFRWAHDHLVPGGALFVQTLSVPWDLVHGDARPADLQRLDDVLPFTGFSTLPQMVGCSDPWFTVERSFDHSSDLLPTYAFWRDNVNRQLPQLRQLIPAENLVLVRRHLDTLIGLAESGTLRLHRIVLRARETGPAAPTS